MSAVHGEGRAPDINVTKSAIVKEFRKLCFASQSVLPPGLASHVIW